MTSFVRYNKVEKVEVQLRKIFFLKKNSEIEKRSEETRKGHVKTVTYWNIQERGREYLKSENNEQTEILMIGRRKA